jgi:hypothetical protein
MHEYVGVSKIYDNSMILLSFKKVDIGALPYEKKDVIKRVTTSKNY